MKFFDYILNVWTVLVVECALLGGLIGLANALAEGLYSSPLFWITIGAFIVGAFWAANEMK